MSSPAVTYLDHMGNDLDVVNAARVSFDRETDADGWRTNELPGGRSTLIPELEERDTRLLHFLARGMTSGELDAVVDAIAGDCYPRGACRTTDLAEQKLEIREHLRKYRQRPLHWSPFAHVMLKVRVSTSFAIARQLETHQIGLAANEISRRYVDGTPEVELPAEWRGRPSTRKQGSGSILPDEALGDAELVAQISASRSVGDYERLLSLGVAPEQARFVLPVATVTQWIWTGSLMAFSRVCQQRLDDHAQQEVRDVVRPLAAICRAIWPESWAALRSY